MPTLMKLLPMNEASTARLAAMASAGIEPSWRFLKSFDLDGRQGRGDIVLTEHRNEAHRFVDLAEAMETWRRQSSKHPTRPDGKPNRPLTAYHATFEEI